MTDNTESKKEPAESEIQDNNAYEQVHTHETHMEPPDTEEIEQIKNVIANSQSEDEEKLSEEVSAGTSSAGQIQDTAPEAQAVKKIEALDPELPRTEQIQKDFYVHKEPVQASQIVVKKSGGALSVLAVLLSLAALGGSGFLFYQSQMNQAQLDEKTAALSTQTHSDTTQLDETLKQTDAENRARQEAQAIKLVQLESMLKEANGKTEQMAALYQELTQTRFDWLISETEYSLNMAQAQLQLTGNLETTIAALEATQSRLASFNKPELSALQTAIVQDIVILKQEPGLNVASVSTQLENLADSVLKLPTNIDTLANTPVPVPTVTDKTLSASAGSWWSRTWASISSGLASLVEIKRLDSDEPVFFHPDQTYFVQENMRLQFNDARLALLQKQEKIYQEDLDAIERSAKRYFDQKSPEVQKLLQQITALKTVKFPQTQSLNNSFSALQAVQKLAKVELSLPVLAPTASEASGLAPATHSQNNAPAVQPQAAPVTPATASVPNPNPLPPTPVVTKPNTGERQL